MSIRIENRVIVIYDNDAEGSARYQETSRLNLPPNMKAMCLPPHHKLSSITTIGPDGTRTSDINGTAVAIECYLGLRVSDAPPVVRWTSYNSRAGSYQGELLNKETYARHFLKLNRLPEGYDTEKLEAVLDALITACKAMAEQEADRVKQRL